MFDEETQPWERLPEESPKAYEAFCRYRDMGPGRSIGKVCQEHAKNIPTLKAWSARFAWVSRCADWDAHLEMIARRQAEREHAAEMTAFRERMRREARDFGSVAHAALALAGKALLKASDEMSPTEIASLLRAAAALMEQSINAEAEAVGVRALEGVLMAHGGRGDGAE